MLKAGFILLTLTLAVILFFMAARVADRAYPDARKRRKFKTGTLLVLIIWLGYISALSLEGVFASASLPPRIPLLLVLPPFLAFLYFFARGRFTVFIDSTPATWPVYFQSFRIVVELLIWGAFTGGILPKEASFEGRNFDVLIGLTAPLVAYFVVGKGMQNKTTIYLWHSAGFAMLAHVVFILILQAYFPGTWGLPESILDKGFGLFPYTLLAGFLMPIAVFMHVFSIVKTRRS